MKLNKDAVMKGAIVAAVLLIIYLIYRSSSCKDSYAEYVPDDEYAENMYEGDAADYAEEEEDYAEEGDEYAEESDYDMPQMENYTLMESTLEDDQANAMFEPEM